MSLDTESADSLLRAIREFRLEFLSWIDTEMARVREHEPGKDLAAAGIPATPGEDSAERGSGASPARPAATIPRPETDPRASAAPLSPRQRLDALARLLDQRLKQ